MLMRPKSFTAGLAALSALMMAALACGGSEAAPTGAPRVITSTPLPAGPTPTLDPSIPSGVNVIGVAGMQLGSSNALALDENNDPLVAYVARDPNGDGDVADAAVNFTRWDRAEANWVPAVTIATTGHPDLDGAHQIKLAYDPGQKTLGLVYVTAQGETKFAVSSDQGATWTSEVVQGANHQSLGAIQSPQLVMTNSQIYLALNGFDLAGALLLTRAGNSGPFTVETPPMTEGMGGLTVAPVGLALDATGAPILTYWQWPLDGAQAQTLALWRRGDPTARVIADNRQQSPEGLSTYIAINGQNQVVTFNGNLDGGQHTLWYVVSTDGGARWTAPEKLPQDGEEYPTNTRALAIDAQGRAALTYDFAFGNMDTSRCGRPKLVRSNDLKNWRACSPDTDRTITNGADIGASTLTLDTNGKVWMLFNNYYRTDIFAQGLWLWREP
jgi:hypothetical protein